MIALFFDTETTGFKSKDFIPEIVQIGALLQDTDTKRVLSELNVIVQPKNPIPPVVTAIHGITDELAAAYGFKSSYVEALFAEIANQADIVVAHNIDFDLGIIADAWPVASAVLKSKEQFCTMKQATDVIKLPKGVYHGKQSIGHKPPKLVEAYAHFFDGKTFDNQHDAMSDVRACRDVFYALAEALGGLRWLLPAPVCVRP